MVERDPTYVPPALEPTRTYMKAQDWTPEEDEVIMRAYIAMKKDREIVKLFPDRSRSPVAQRRMHLTNPKPTEKGMEYLDVYRRVMRDKNGPQRNKSAVSSNYDTW
jgi:hypothetical protein